MSAYSDYLTYTRRLLHDANGQFWTDSELLDYINRARNRVVRDTGCYRNLQTRNLLVNTETYALGTGFSVSPVIDCVNLTIHWGNSRIALAYQSWSQFNARSRYWQNYVGRPSIFSVYGYASVYVQPLPDIEYVAEWDTVCQPAAIVDGTSVEVIPSPFTDVVPYFAARLAKIKEQSFGEAESFNALYEQEKSRAQGSTFTRRTPNPYRR